ncbi:MAG: hypothetical protein IKD78_09160 [Bacteroidales bacterium]|nr:hypothetical protein [Bacteroidales bacterium]
MTKTSFIDHCRACFQSLEVPRKIRKETLKLCLEWFDREKKNIPEAGDVVGLVRSVVSAIVVDNF